MTGLPERPWSCPGGRLVTGSAVDRETWLRERRSLLGASDMAALFGASSYGDSYTTWLDKTGRSPSDEQNDAQARGLIFEAAVIELWVERFAETEIITRRAGLMRSRSNPHAGATVDRLSACPEGRCVIEAKTQMDVTEWGTDEQPEVPVAYQFQGQWQLFVTGRDHVHFVVMGPRWQPLHRIMHRDEELIGKMDETAREWWEQFVELDVAPEPTHVALDALKQQYRGRTGQRAELDAGDMDLVRRVNAAKQVAKDADGEHKSLLAQLQLRVGNATEIVDAITGDLVATWRPGKTIDGADAAWRKNHPDIVEQFSPAAITRTFDVAAAVDADPTLIADGALRYRRTFSLK